MTNGTLETYQDIWAGEDWWFEYEGAEAYQLTFIEADRGNASSSARDDDGNLANTSATMTNGIGVGSPKPLVSGAIDDAATGRPLRLWKRWKRDVGVFATESSPQPGA